MQLAYFFRRYVNVQVPNGHEEDELADGEVMNYMCRDDEVMKENLSSYSSFEQQKKSEFFS